MPDDPGNSLFRRKERPLQCLSPDHETGRVESSALRYVDYASEVFHMDYKIAWNAERDNQAVRLLLDEVRKTTWPCVKILTDR